MLRILLQLHNYVGMLSWCAIYIIYVADIYPWLGVDGHTAVAVTDDLSEMEDVFEFSTTMALEPNVQGRLKYNANFWREELEASAFALN